MLWILTAISFVLGYFCNGWLEDCLWRGLGANRSNRLRPDNPHFMDMDYEIYQSADDYVLLPRMQADRHDT